MSKHALFLAHQIINSNSLTNFTYVFGLLYIIQITHVKTKKHPLRAKSLAEVDQSERQRATIEI